MKTKLWHVYLVRRGDTLCVLVSATARPIEHIDHCRFRTITPNAAGRRYIRNNLATALHVADDGMNEPADLNRPSERKRANRIARRAAPEIIRLTS